MAVRRILTLIAATAITLCALPVPTRVAHGSPRSDPTTGRAAFTGATMPHPTSLALNPAAIGLGAVSETYEVYVAVTSVLQQLHIQRKTIDLDSGALATGPDVRDTQLGPGGMLAVLWHPSERLSLGFEARLPPPDLQPEDHTALRYHTLGGGQRSYLVTVGVSLKVTNAFYFGASLSHENSSLRLRYARDTALEAGHGARGVDSDCGGAPCGIENPEATELYDVTVRTPWIATSNLKVNLGTVFRVAPDVWIGLAYHTPPGFNVQTALDGTMDVTRAPRDGGEVLHGGATVLVSYPASVDGEIRARLPKDLELHVGGRWEDLSRMQAYDVRGYGSTFTRSGVPEWMLRARGLHDAFAMWAGVEQLDTGQRLRGGGRIGFETSSVDDRRTSPLTIAPGAFTLDLGAQGRVYRGAPWMLQLSYGLALSPSVDATNSAFDPRFRVDCIESGFDYTTRGCAATRAGFAVATAAGTYTRIDHALRLGFLYELP